MFNKFSKYKKTVISKAKHFKGSIKGNLVYVYWFERISNFGDLLNPVLLKHYGLTPINSPLKSAEVIALGSVLQDLPEYFSGYIVGAGLISDMERRFPNSRILAVRGRLTRECIGADQNIPLGDPGLLVPMLYSKKQQKKYVLGLIPHFVDKDDERIRRLWATYPNDVAIIDVQQKPKTVISKIRQCEHILSSSLHGLITADAFGIPNAWICLSDKVIGSGFKFHDYVSAFDSHIEPNLITGKESLSSLIKLTKLRVNNLTEIQNNLDNAFQIMATEIRK